LVRSLCFITLIVLTPHSHDEIDTGIVATIPRSFPKIGNRSFRVSDISSRSFNGRPLPSTLTLPYRCRIQNFYMVCLLFWFNDSRDTENTQTTKTHAVLVILKTVMEISIRELEILKEILFRTEFENSGVR
jgi:hypothetical protein